MTPEQVTHFVDGCKHILSFHFLPSSFHGEHNSGLANPLPRLSLLRTLHRNPPRRRLQPDTPRNDRHYFFCFMAGQAASFGG